MFSQRPHLLFSSDLFVVNDICVERCVLSQKSTEHAYLYNTNNMAGATAGAELSCKTRTAWKLRTVPTNTEVFLRSL